MASVRRAVKRVLFGSAEFSRFRPVALAEPQTEVGVWLRGLGQALDVTERSVIASANPVTVGIGMARGLDPAAPGRPLSLELRERGPRGRVLGEIELTLWRMLPAGDLELGLFRTPRCTNYSLPRPWLWSRYAYYAWKRRRQKQLGSSPDTAISSSDERCLFVFYICPRPVMVATVGGAAGVNLVPLDLLGPVGSAHTAFTIRNTSAIVPIIEQSRRIALSSVPKEHIAVAYELGRNHRAAAIEPAALPFPVVLSKAFSLPVPDFALRVREFEVERLQAIGDYTLFLGRLVEDERRREGLQFFLVHGFRSVTNGAVP